MRLLRDLQVLRRIQVRNHLVGVRRRQIELRLLVVRIQLDRVLEVSHSFFVARILERLNTLVELVARLQAVTSGCRRKQQR